MAKSFINKEDLLRHILDSKKKGSCTTELANDFIKMIDHLLKSKWFNKYNPDILEEMRSASLYKAVLNYSKYDESKGTSPFAYFTRLMFNASWDVYFAEKKYWDIKKGLTDDAINELNNFYPEQARKFMLNQMIKDNNDD